MAKKGKSMSVGTNSLGSAENDVFMQNVIAKSHNQVKKYKYTQAKNNDLDDILGENSLQLVDNESKEQKAKLVDWKNIKSSGKYHKLPVELWSDTNMFSGLRSLCKSKNNEYANIISSEIGIAVRGRFINKLRVLLADKMHTSICNRTLYNYIAYFVGYEIDEYVAASGKFSVYDFLSKRSVNRFVKYTNKEIAVDVEKEKIYKEAPSNIESIYNLGGTNLLLSYGIVIPYNWLLQKKYLTASQSKSVVTKFYQDAGKEGKEFLNEIKQITKKYSPYLSSYGDENIHAMLYEFGFPTIVFDENGKGYF